MTVLYLSNDITLRYLRVCEWKINENKVDMLNKILHTLREAFYCRVILMKLPANLITYHSQPPPLAHSDPNISKNIFGAQISAI